MWTYLWKNLQDVFEYRQTNYVERESILWARVLALYSLSSGIWTLCGYQNSKKPIYRCFIEIYQVVSKITDGKQILLLSVYISVENADNNETEITHRSSWTSLRDLQNLTSNPPVQEVSDRLEEVCLLHSPEIWVHCLLLNLQN